jgi:hypothetical protein
MQAVSSQQSKPRWPRKLRGERHVMDDHVVPGLTQDSAEMLELGALVGQHNAFGLIAGRCSAAQAESLRRLREGKIHRKCASDWRDFCAKYLRMSGSQADRIIALLDEFGPGYFELSQLTRISPETYRAVEPVIKDHALHFRGEVVQLDPENAGKVAAVVAELRRQAAAKEVIPPANTAKRMADIERRFSALLRDRQQILSSSETNWANLSGMLKRMSSAFHKLLSDNRL